MDWIRRVFGGGGTTGADDLPEVSLDARPASPTGGPPASALPYRRTAYQPEVEDGPFGAGSGFGGVPFLADGVDHPFCPRCRLPMPLIAQVDLASLPAPVADGDGLLQLFYCSRVQGMDACDEVLEGWAAFSVVHNVRIVPAGPGGAPSPGDTLFDPVRVTGWTPADDYPNWEELETLAGDAGPASDELEAYPLEGEKLGGWPHWVQGIEYPSCLTCGSTMGLVLQVDSEHSLPTMWGDAGIGHVTQCPQHPEVLAFAWACY